MAAPANRDGAPTPTACEALGFPKADHRRDSYSRRGRMVGGAMYAPPAMAMPPPPAPPPAPYPATRASPMQEMVVTGSVRSAQVMPSPRPGDINTERYPHAQANPIKLTAQEPVSTFSVDVDTAAYANVRRFLNDGQSPPRDAVRVEELINYFDYGYAKPSEAQVPFKPFVAVTPSPWSADRQIVHIGLQGYDIPRTQQPPLNLVFLIDTSGSMSDEAKLPLARKALNLLVDQLRPQDRVSMVAYAGSAGAVLPPTSGREKLKMRCALGALESGGSTAGGQGLALAYDLAVQNFDPKAVNRVILMTDGDFNVGVADPEKLTDFVAAKRKTGVYLSVYGLGEGNYNDTLMQALAQNGNGTAGYIDTLNEARKSFRDDFSGSLFPIADDVKIQVEFNPRAVSEYRLIGYETRLLNREDFNNDRVDAGEVGSGSSVTALYEVTPAGARPSSDPLRYGAPAARAAAGGEIAFLKVRYKLPGDQASRLIERPIGANDTYAQVADAPESTRWALAVAGFGQKLRGDPWLSPGFGWKAVGDLAQTARGSDLYGLRAEFVQLARAAGETRTVNESGN
ncbi:VWA domain-containing protein [Phenylobacterium sp.]|uniref:vWA domain-containing protein n=1 Tax=Phenylobacterium sp. TaxID=1871053 RepID=UPI0025E6FDEF|nr:VWA domain-containing protein [Phenylobacterium sp.]